MPETVLARALNAQMAKFLEVDVALGLTFAHIATNATKDPHKRERNTLNAQKALASVLKYKSRTRLDTARAILIESKVDRLKTALKNLHSQ